MTGHAWGAMRPAINFTRGTCFNHDTEEEEEKEEEEVEEEEEA